MEAQQGLSRMALREQELQAARDQELQEMRDMEVARRLQEEELKVGQPQRPQKGQTKTAQHPSAVQAGFFFFGYGFLHGDFIGHIHSKCLLHHQHSKNGSVLQVAFNATLRTT